MLRPELAHTATQLAHYVCNLAHNNTEKRDATRGRDEATPGQPALTSRRRKASQGAAAACDWSDDEDASHDNDAWKDAFDREVTRRPHRGVARDCLVP